MPADVEKARELLDRIARPLKFAARNDFANLSVVKGLESTLSAPIAALVSEDPSFAILGGMIRGIDSMSNESKAERIREILAALESPPKKKRETKPRPKASFDREEGLALIPLTAVTGVGKATAEKLAAKGIESVLDALLWLPKRYEDRRRITPISELVPGEFAVVRGRVIASAMPRGAKGRAMFEVVIGDGTGTLSLRWFRFHTESMKKRFLRGKDFVVAGTVTAWGAMRQLVHPDVESAERWEESPETGIAPIYPEVDGVRPKQLRKVLQEIARRFAKRMPDPLPDPILSRRSLPNLADAIEMAHLPETIEPGVDPDRAVRRRLVYDELFFFQLFLARRKDQLEHVPGFAHVSKVPWRTIAEEMLPFALTRAQLRAIDEIAKDLAEPSPMNRLLQGDVGSGKTAVAMIAAAIVAKAGHQVAILAPTEILAEQHAATSDRYLSAVKLTHALLTGSTKAKERRQILSALADGSLDVVIGTHAILEPDVEIARLGLAIIDEQHRFGVEQRAVLRNKSKDLPPDVLVMTATPIPRTLALTIYGDLEVSIIDERPPGRRPVTTRVLKESDRPRAYADVAEAVGAGRQAYVVFPLVEASESLELKAATEAVEEIRKRFPTFSVGLLHGRMKGEEKASVMDAFRKNEVQVLVSTTVIEVGVDVPNATVMIVEHAERFGLSQIHQLRGRVGRGKWAGTCLLVVGGGGQDAWSKLAVLERTDDGFQVAEADLEIRGPGELLGTRQSGIAALAMADLVRDAALLDQARADAFAVIESDPKLEREEHRAIAAEIERRMKGALAFAGIA
jgi:ATP-dependent DNA helicase RecG